MTISVRVTVRQDQDTLNVVWTPTSNAARTMPLSAPGRATGRVTVTSRTGLHFRVVPKETRPAGGNWLQLSPDGQLQTNTTIDVAVNAAGLSGGSYQTTLDFIDTNNFPLATLVVTLDVTGPTLIATPPALYVTAVSNARIPDRTITLTSSNPATPVVVQNIDDDRVPWVTVSRSLPSGSGNTAATPGTLTLSFNTANLREGEYTDTIRIVSNATNNPLTIPVTLNISAAPVQTISHITYGGPWQTTIMLVNMDTQPAGYTLNFWSETGTPLMVPLAEGSTTGTIPVGGRATIQTGGTARDIVNGWAEVASDQRIGGTAIFRVTDQNQEAAVPLLTSPNSRVRVPFDTGGGLAIGIALVNPSQTTATPVTMIMRDQQGNSLPMTITDYQGAFSPTAVTSLLLQPRAHRAFNARPLNAAGPVSGTIEFSSPSVAIYALGVRSVNDKAFTSINAAVPQPGAVKTVSHVTYGGPWQTTLILVNTGTQEAQYTVNFWGDNGTPLAVPLAQGSTSGTIPVGGRATIQTGGTARDTVNGWAEVVSEQQVGGTAIFRVTDQNQEAAVPLLSSGGSKVQVPFDTLSGVAIGIALVNPSQTTANQVNVQMRDQQGNRLPMTITNSQGAFSTTDVSSLTLPPHSHMAFNARPLNATGPVSGVIEFTSLGGPIYALGVRSVGNQAFTSIEALAQ